MFSAKVKVSIITISTLFLGSLSLVSRAIPVPHSSKPALPKTTNAQTNAKNSATNNLSCPTLPLSIVMSVARREQRLSHSTFAWQINEQQNSGPQGPSQERPYYSTRTWQISRNGAETLVTGTREQGNHFGNFVQYYKGGAGIIVNAQNTADGEAVASLPPTVWGTTGESIRYREPFMTGFGLMPEHLVLLTGLNPLALYDAHWRMKETTAISWTLEATVPQGFHPDPATTETIDLTLSRRLGGAPAKIVMMQGGETWTYQTLCYQRLGADWVCDKFSLVAEDPLLPTRKQVWTLQAMQPIASLPPLLIPNESSNRAQVSDYRLAGLNLTPEEYLNAAEQQPSQVVRYAWPGHFLTVAELAAMKRP